MEDFLVLSLLDLQLDATKHQQVDKREVIAYIMLGETCVDCLVLGSPNASLQDQTALQQAANQNPDSGGAANPNLFNQDENERGSHVEEQEAPKVQPLTNMSKRTKIPLAGLSHGPNNKQAPKTFQIVVRQIGTKSERFGSISFSLKRFQKSTAQSFCHWVTLYDSLDDDLFEGDLGRDDDFDYPRVLLDYQIVSSKYTSMINAADKLSADVEKAKRNADDLRANRSRSSRKTAKATRMTNVSQTVEFVETRAAKITGQRAPFEGRVMTGSQQETYLTFRTQEIRDQEEVADRQEQESRRKQMFQLQKLIETYSVDNFRNELQEDIEETKDEAQYQQQSKNRQIEEVLDLVKRMTGHHGDSLEQPVQDIIAACFETYGGHLDELERKDIANLRKRVGELKGMQNNLARDLQESDRNKANLLREREQLLFANTNPGERRGDDRLRLRIMDAQQILNNRKADLIDNDQEMLRNIADDVKPGRDDLYNDNYNEVYRLYDSANTALQTQLDNQQKKAFTDQDLRNHKLQNMKLEEEIDAQIDQKISIQQKSQRARKQIARMIRKTQTFLVDSEKLLKEKLLAVKSMNHELGRLNIERGIVSKKKQEAQYAFYQSENQRTEMLLHFSRLQAESDQERMASDGLKKQRRENTVQLGREVLLMSTKPENTDQYIRKPEEVLDEEQRLRQVSRELEVMQSRYMRAQQEKENLKARQVLQLSKGNVEGNVSSARQQLTTFMIESEGDVLQMKRELTSTQDRITSLEKSNRQQESRRRELETLRAATERRLDVVVKSVDALTVRNDANKNVDFIKQTKDLQKKNQQNQHKVDQMLKRVQNKKVQQDSVIDQMIRTALQKARRNITIMQKMANGIYKVKNKSQLVMLDLDTNTQQCMASYTDEQGQVKSESLSEFIKRI